MILELKNVVVNDPRSNEVIVHGSSFIVRKNTCLSIVGESGSGKSMTTYSLNYSCAQWHFWYRWHLRCIRR